MSQRISTHEEEILIATMMKQLQAMQVQLDKLEKEKEPLYSFPFDKDLYMSPCPRKKFEQYDTSSMESDTSSFGDYDDYDDR